MGNLDDLLGPDAKAEAVEEKKLAAVRREPRAVAVARGRRLGEEEADRRNETGKAREQRVARAMMYAAWEYDGKPLNYGDRYEQEFGVARPAVYGSWERR